MSLCIKCNTAFIDVPESKLPEDRLCLWCQRDALRDALKTAINTVECASIDPITKRELPWYTQAKAALRTCNDRP